MCFSVPWEEGDRTLMMVEILRGWRMQVEAKCGEGLGLLFWAEVSRLKRRLRGFLWLLTSITWIVVSVWNFSISPSLFSPDWWFIIDTLYELSACRRSDSTRSRVYIQIQEDNTWQDNSFELSNARINTSSLPMDKSASCLREFSGLLTSTDKTTRTWKLSLWWTSLNVVWRHETSMVVFVRICEAMIAE
jgi:hypothetical protein